MAANRYPEGMVDWIKANYINLTLPELTEICNDIFKTNLSKKAMSSLKKDMASPELRGRRYTVEHSRRRFAAL